MHFINTIWLKLIRKHIAINFVAPTPLIEDVSGTDTCDYNWNMSFSQKFMGVDASGVLVPYPIKHLK